MAEQMNAPPKQIDAFFDLLIETATVETRRNGEFTIPGLGKLVKAQRAFENQFQECERPTIARKACSDVSTLVILRFARTLHHSVRAPYCCRGLSQLGVRVVIERCRVGQS